MILEDVSEPAIMANTTLGMIILRPFGEESTDSAYNEHEQEKEGETGCHTM